MNRLNRRKERLLNEIAERVAVKLIRENPEVEVDSRIWSFSGHGNYSDVYDWDQGLTTTLGQEMTYEQYQESIVDDEPLPTKVPGVEITEFNTYGGSRNVYGYVHASDKREALDLLKQYEEEYVEVPYERP